MGTAAGFKLDEFFAALSDRTRLRLLNLMRDGEVCVCFFAETLGTNNPKISRHLAYLRRAGLVKARREGKWMHYSLNPPADSNGSDLFESLLKTFDSDPEMQADLASLADVCCSPRNQPIQINGKNHHVALSKIN